MTVCKNCGSLVMEFTFSDGKQWWHTPSPGGGNQLHQRCAGGEGVAEPAVVPGDH